MRLGMSRKADPGINLGAVNEHNQRRKEGLWCTGAEIGFTRFPSGPRLISSCEISGKLLPLSGPQLSTCKPG